MSHLVAGIDIGSGRTKAVLLDDQENILARVEAKTLANFGAIAEQILEAALQKAGRTRDQVDYVATTGLGRYSIPFRDIQITEITCAARGARSLFPDTRCVLEMGSQSTRAIHLRDDGKVYQFRSNDRCAAGSGGFLEKAAKYLEVPIDRIGRLSLHSRNPQTISSVCAVLGESEIINHVSNGSPVEDIFRGIHDSLADRAIGLLRSVGMSGKLAVGGGVARQIGMIQAIEEKLGAKVYACPHPEYVCALGAALLGLQRLQKRQTEQNAA